MESTTGRTWARHATAWLLGLILVQGCSSVSPLFGYHTDNVVENLEKLKEIDLKHQVPFFGRKYRTAYISVDGLLGFSEETSYRQIHYKAGSGDPAKDIPFIGPFHYHGDKPPVSRSYQGDVFYRLIADRQTLDDLSVYVLNSTVGHRSFRPAVALRVTWLNVTDALSLEDEGCSAVRGSANQCPSATFQILFVASTTHSYIFINYEKMTIPLHPYYQAGFNGGDGLGWKSILPCGQSSCKLTLNDLPRLQGSDVKGRFIFDVGGQQIRRGGCIPPELEADDVLEFAPQFASLLGGQMLNISGTCIPQQASVKCKFGTDPHAVITEGIVVNSMLARCPVPRLTQRGDTEISFSVGGQDFRHKSTITVLMGNIPRSMQLQQDGPRRRWNETDADELRVTWLTSTLSHDEHVLLDIKLIGYRETQTEVIWKELTTLGHGVPNTGVFSFVPSNHRCHGEDCHLFEVGVIEAQLRRRYWHQSNTDVAVSYWIHPIGWFVTDALKARYGDDWFVDKCTAWYDEDKKDMSWLDDLLHCPCTLEQALADFGRWQPDKSCSIYNKKPTNCFYHIGAIHCVRSFQPTKRGAGNQCCYGADKMLKYAADSFQGSTPDRHHDWGAAPYNMPGYVPATSHWLADVITFYYCCLWTGYEYCDYYMDQRPTRDCVGYTPPRAAIAYGDPHLRTFDGHVYHFGGKGDFWLYRSQNFKIQGRFDIRHEAYAFSRVNTTVLTGLAMVEGAGQTVEIRLAPKHLVSGNRLQVMVDRISRFFTHEPLRTQNFKGVSVITNEGRHHLTRHGNFTVLFQSGVGVMVTENNEMLHVTVNLPPEYKNRQTPSGGLFGTWNEDKGHHFTAADGSTVSVSAPPGDIYRRFGLSWAVKREESLFQKAVDVDTQFVPTFTAPPLPPNASFTENDVNRLCGNNVQCRFDFKVTGQKQIAEATIRTSQWFEALRTSQRPVAVCGLLDVPRSIKDNYNYSLGSTVTITGCRNGATIQGEATHTCIRDNRGRLMWSPPVEVTCSGLDEGVRTAMVVGIAVAVIVVLGVSIVVAIVLYKRRHKGAKTQSKDERRAEHGEADAMMSELDRRVKESD